MSNPFPGVNPYIEAEGHWEDFHGTAIPILREALLAKLPREYDATVNERQYLDTGPLEIRIRDVSVERLTAPPARPRPLNVPAAASRSWRRRPSQRRSGRC